MLSSLCVPCCRWSVLQFSTEWAAGWVVGDIVLSAGGKCRALHGGWSVQTLTNHHRQHHQLCDCEWTWNTFQWNWDNVQYNVVVSIMTWTRLTQLGHRHSQSCFKWGKRQQLGEVWDNGGVWGSWDVKLGAWRSRRDRWQSRQLTVSHVTVSSSVRLLNQLVV